jgi:hypothetical protein
MKTANIILRTRAGLHARALRLARSWERPTRNDAETETRLLLTWLAGYEAARRDARRRK